MAAITDAAGDRRRAVGDALVTTPGLDGLPAAGDATTIDTAGPDDVALLIYTSGTTGTPKGVPMSHANLLASAEAVRLAWRWTPDDRLVLALPLYHMHGLGVGLHGTLVTGASAVLQDRFDPDAGDRRRRRRGDDVLRRADDVDPPGGQPARRGAGHVAPRRVRLGAAAARPAPGPGRAHRPPAAGALRHVGDGDAHVEPVRRRAPRRLGRLPAARRRAAPGDAAPATARARSRCAARTCSRGYLHRPEATAEAFDGGWFRTGDLGEVDADGYLHIVGRSKELIISGGFNVFPREVEDVLRACPGVVDACVVGVPDAEWGERVTAFVVGDTDEATLRAWVAERLVAYKRPRRWERIDDVPRNSMGKMQRDVLVRRATGS